MKNEKEGKTKLLEALKKKKAKMYADSDEPVAADDDAPTEGADSSDDDTPDAEETPDAPPAPVTEAPAQPVADIPPAPTPAPAPPEDQDPNLVHVVGQRPAPPPRLASTPDEFKADLQAKDAEWADALAKGQIKPKTYSQLAGEGTLGKIGTLFGLLLSGAGSGLAHQSNAVMDIMNKEIQNDLESQKASKENAMNILRLTQQHELNQSVIKKNEFDNALTKAQTEQVPIDSKYKLAQARSFDAETAVKNDVLAHARANRVALHSLIMAAKKLPEGSPARQKADNALAIMAQQVDAMNSNLFDKAAALQGLNLSINNPGGMNPNGDETDFQNNQRSLRIAGKKDIAEDNESKHLPSVPGAASVPLTTEDRNNVTSSQALIGSLQRLKQFAVSNPHPLPGSAADREGKALAAQVQGDFRMATHGGVFKEGEQNFINQVVPGDPTTWSPFGHVADKIDTVINETNARNNQFLKSKGFQGLSVPKSAPAEQTKTVNGVKYKRGPNGEAVRVK